MQSINGIKLADVVEEASTEVLNSKKSAISKKIQSILYRIDGLSYDLKKLEIEKQKKQKKLESAKQKLDKIREGDWSLIDNISDAKAPLEQ